MFPFEYTDRHDQVVGRASIIELCQKIDSKSLQCAEKFFQKISKYFGAHIGARPSHVFRIIFSHTL